VLVRAIGCPPADGQTGRCHHRRAAPFAVLYLDRVVQDWDGPVVPDFVAILLPWAVVLVALGYLAVSLFAGAARWLEPGEQGDAGGSVGREGSAE
jgi:hypothetical protein